MSYMEDAWERQLEASMEAEREWYYEKEQALSDGWTLVVLNRNVAFTTRTLLADWMIENCRKNIHSR